MKMQHFTLALVLALAGFACDSPELEGKGVGQPQQQGSSSGGGSASSNGIEKMEDQLRGAWISSCLPDGRRSTGNYIELDGDRFRKTAYFFSDAHCQNFDYRGEELQGLFKIRRPSPVVPGAYEVDIDASDAVGTEVARFDLFRLDGKKLYFGALPGNTESTRAKDLDPSIFYTRIE